jgi:4'-phosphopantetheinyl transferase
MTRRKSSEIHILVCPLNEDAARTERSAALLSADEMARASRFVFEKDRRRFIVARAILRQALGQHLKASPRQLTFRYGPHGKPYLESSPAWRLCFSMCRSARTSQ